MKICEKTDCSKPMFARHMCQFHYYRWYHNERDASGDRYDVCPTPECGRKKISGSAMCKRCNQFRWRYSLTVERTAELFSTRVCGNPGCGATGSTLHLDHDHACCGPGKFSTSHKKSCGECVRGWLCRACNMSLGALQEDPERIRGLLAYIGATR